MVVVHGRGRLSEVESASGWSSMARKMAEKAQMHSHTGERKTERGTAMGVLKGFWWMHMVVQEMRELEGIGGGGGWLRKWPKTAEKAARKNATGG